MTQSEKKNIKFLRSLGTISAMMLEKRGELVSVSRGVFVNGYTQGALMVQLSHRKLRERKAAIEVRGAATKERVPAKGRTAAKRRNKINRNK